MFRAQSSVTIITMSFKSHESTNYLHYQGEFSLSLLNVWWTFYIVDIGDYTRFV